jgi:hypothetical protein
MHSPCSARLVVALRPPKDRSDYDIIGTRNLFGEESLFINFGYWKTTPQPWMRRAETWPVLLRGAATSMRRTLLWTVGLATATKTSCGLTSLG